LVFRWRLAGAANKPPCGAVAKSYGIERTRKRSRLTGSGVNNGDEPPLARVFGSDAGADLQSVPCLSVVSKHHLRSKKRNDLCCLNPELKQLEVITYK
jgi:hypothetical protein